MTGIPKRLDHSGAAREGSVAPDAGESSSSAPDNLPEHALLRRAPSSGNNPPQIQAARVVGETERKKLSELRKLESELERQVRTVAETRVLLEKEKEAYASLRNVGETLPGLNAAVRPEVV